MAPISPDRPEATAASTSLRMRCLYSAVNTRRFAFAKTSVSLTEGTTSIWLIVSALVALDTKLPRQDCLIHIGREGAARIASGTVLNGPKFCMGPGTSGGF